MTDKLHELADRIEAGTAEEQDALLIEAWFLIERALNKPIVPGGGVRLVNMLAAYAYESAAMMLVPEGWYGQLSFGDQRVWAWMADPNNDDDPMTSEQPFMAEASTRAFALAAAALRAHAAVGEG